MSIPRIVAAAIELGSFLERLRFEYCFIGGLAVQRWGEPRLTRDADATVLTLFERDEEFIEALLREYEPRNANPKEFALRARVALVRSSEGIDLDIALGGLPFEQRCVERSSLWKIEEDALVRTCSAEDLVVHKAFAAREIDWIDIDGILVRQGGNLNGRLIIEELEPLVELKEDATILPRLRRMLTRPPT